MTLHPTYSRSDGLYNVEIAAPLLLTLREARRLVDYLDEVACDDIAQELMSLIGAHERHEVPARVTAPMGRPRAGSPADTGLCLPEVVAGLLRRGAMAAPDAARTRCERRER